VVYDELQGLESFVENSISTFFENHIRRRMPFDDCVMDVAIIQREVSVSGEQKVVVIEFNGFDEYTGPSLFSWDRDSAVLRSSGGAVSTRLRTTLLENISNVAEVCVESTEFLEKERILKHRHLLPGASNQKQETLMEISSRKPQIMQEAPCLDCCLC
jgi:hypothetical protein